MQIIPKAVIYCRVAAKNDIHNIYPFSSQEKECREYAKKRGYEVVAVFSDVGSGIDNKRTALKLLAKHCANKKNRVKVVIATDPARLSRNGYDLVSIYKHLKTISVDIHYTKTAIVDAETMRFTLH